MTEKELATSCINFVLKNEGGYSNDPDDLGRETYKGVSRKSFPAWDGWKVIDGYKKSHKLSWNEKIQDEHLDKLVFDLYMYGFWKPMNLFGINSANVVLQMFDFGINAGARTAIKLAQRLSGAVPDGRCGYATKMAINELDPDSFFKAYQEGRKAHYRTRKTFKVHGEGWFKRVDKTKF